MDRSDPYGLAAYGARLENARLHKRQKTLEAHLVGERLLDAREAQTIAAAMSQAVPGCAVQLRAALEDGEPPMADERAFFAMLSRSWTHLSPLMGVCLKNAAWACEGNALEVRIPEKLYHAARTCNGADRLKDFLKETYELKLDIRIVPDASMEPPQPGAAEGLPRARPRRRTPRRKRPGRRKRDPARAYRKRTSCWANPAHRSPSRWRWSTRRAAR